LETEIISNAHKHRKVRHAALFTYSLATTILCTQVIDLTDLECY